MERNAPDWGGYVKLWRKAKDSEPFADPHLWQLFCWLLLTATFRPQSVPVQTGRGWSTVRLQAGQLMFGRNKHGKLLNLAPSTLRDRMKRLEKLGCICMKRGRHCSIVTICNWGIYQSVSFQGRQPTNNQPTGKRNAPDCDGYVHLWRKAKDSKVFADPHLWQFFCWLLCSAAHQRQSVPMKTGNGSITIKLQPGQLIFGSDERAELLEELNSISIESENDFCIVTICNWGLYQSMSDDAQQPTDRQTTGERQPADTYKNAKNAENDKNAEKSFDLKEFSLEEIAPVARSIARKLKPTNNAGRDLIIKACIIAHRELSEDWLSRSLRAVTESNTPKGNAIGDFRVCLRDKAQIDGKDFEALLSSIPRIPDEWFTIFDRLDDAA